MLKDQFDEKAFENDAATFRRAIKDVEWSDRDSIEQVLTAYYPLKSLYRRSDALTQLTAETIQGFFQKDLMGPAVSLAASYFQRESFYSPNITPEEEAFHEENLPVIRVCADIIKDVEENPRSNKGFWSHWVGHMQAILGLYGRPAYKDLSHNINAPAYRAS